MPEDATWPVATPTQIAEAWHTGTSNIDTSYVHRELRNHPVPRGVVDPIFHRDNQRKNGGWHVASDIVNPGAIESMKRVLEKRSLRAPEATEKAWQRTLERLATKHQIKMTFDNAMFEAWEDEDCDTAEEWCEKVIKAFEDHLEQVR